MTTIDDSIAIVMNRLTMNDKVSVYSVMIVKKDYSTEYTAIVQLRGKNAKAYSATGVTPLDALLEVERVIESLVCPACGRV